jgi:bacterioferritin (cytochrome b1)
MQGFNMQNNSMTISEQRLLEKCREIELLCKELYDYFAELFAGNDEAARLWKKTADEEHNHAEQFSMALKLSRGLPCLVTVDPQRVDSIISQLRTVINKVKLSPPGLKDALCSAISLENYLTEFHLGCVAIFEDKSYNQLFSAMMASDDEHIASLQAAYDRFAGFEDWTYTG